MIKKIIWISVLLITVAYPKEFAFSKTEENVLKIVLRSDGYINKDLYDQFWKDLRNRVNKNDISTMKKIIPEAQHTQIILWKAAKKSIILKKPYYSPEVNAVLANMKSKNADQAYNNSIKLLECAASGNPMQMNGSTQYITDELADFILDNLNKSMKRFDILLSDRWGNGIEN